MNTTQLQCFTTLAGTLNYMRAAEELHMTQPAVSRQIQSLEEELGARLFYRTTRSVSLTEAGAQFLPRASSMLHTWYDSVQQISSLRAQGKESLRIGYAESCALPLVARFLSPLMSSPDSVSPELILDQTDANLQRLVSGDLDLVFGIRDAAFSHEAVTFLSLAQERFFCVCRKDHPLALSCRERKSTSVSSSELFSFRQILDIPPYLLKTAFSRGHRMIPVNEELDNILVSSASEAYCLVSAGAGSALLPGHLLREDPDLVTLFWEESPETKLGIYCLSDTLKDQKSPVYHFLKNAEAYYREKENGQ